MMKTHVFATLFAALALSSTIASAEEFAGAYPYGSCCPEECFDGFYVGGNIGVLSHHAGLNDTDGFLVDNAGWTVTDTNIAGGVQFGYDWQRRSRVLGIVADWNASNVASLLPSDPNGVFNDQLVQSDLKWFSTIRGRAGMAIEDTLIYVSAGPAVAGFDTVWQDAPVVFSRNDTRWGWCGSVGTEFKYSQNVSVGLDLYFLQFADDYATFNDGASDFTFGQNDSGWGGRVLVNYRFGG